ncbi:dihydrodipicolinate synthase family protein [Candidatus Riflebacteria bacterium]
MNWKKIETNPSPIGRFLALFIQKIAAKKIWPFIVAIGGPGGSGKSTLAKKIQRFIPDSTILELDDYRRARAERDEFGILGSHPDGNQIATLKENLHTLKKNVKILKPVYDRISGKCGAEEEFHPKAIILLDGEASFLPEIMEMLDFSIFLDLPLEMQLKSRLNRDMTRYKFSLEKTLNTFVQSNIYDFPQFMLKQKSNADLILRADSGYHFQPQAILAAYYHMWQKAMADFYIERTRPEGLIVPILTPFDSAKNIDVKTFVRHIKFLEEKGIKNIWAGGTTGEFFSLAKKERRELFLTARQEFGGTIIFHCGFSNQKDTLEEAIWGEAHGADALAAITPFFFKNAPVQGVVDYFNGIATKIKLPLIIYHFPQHTGNVLNGRELQNIKHWGIKDSSGNTDLIQYTENYFPGTDRHIFEAWNKGATGFISALANAFPETFLKMEMTLKEEDVELAEEIQEEICRLAAFFSSSEKIAELKCYMAKNIPGYPHQVRPPMCNLNDARKKEFLSLF